MNKREKTRHLRRQKTKIMLAGNGCKHERRTFHSPGKMVCLSCDEVITILAQGVFATQIGKEASKKSYVLKTKTN